eukprot:TRINITY_DN9604_c0_g1_i1.p1 TRINITY_DN9604_c0_g1~~TRINITY_DN9604_c0_g1_i1.p1  ORF type:complete len:1215 (-),score=383.83 TRINITY_DN9604_c0_g1_i1:174-3818(-)
MHIKKVIVEGFKSYLSQSDFDPFNPRINVIVGRNGAGKSNFFEAISFVLGDLFSNIRAEDRQSLLHGEVSSQTASVYAYVEIYFDNTDKQFPIEKDEVVLRRQIGRKKDEYFLDKKHVTKNDVINLLETAGFSRSNPYYIVKQGKVTTLATMRDAERLELLKEVAGTRVYDERREESQKIMKETKLRKDKITEVLNYIEDRLNELKEERKELEQYSQLDRSRRSLEYTIYTKELESTIIKLQQLEETRKAETANAANILKEANIVQDKLKKKEKKVKQLSLQLTQLSKEKEQLEKEKQDLVKRATGLGLNVQDATTKLSQNKHDRTQYENELKEIDRQIQNKTKELEDILPLFRDAQEDEKKLRTSIAEKERRINELYTKQGRGSRFSSKAERNKWIKSELQDLKRSIDAKATQVKNLSDELKKGRKTQEDLRKAIVDRTSGLEERRKVIENLSTKLAELKKDRDELSNQRKELWKTDSDLDTQIQGVKSDLQKYERLLASSMNRALSSGLQAVKRIVAEHNISGVHGQLIELMEVPVGYSRAVEVTAGNSLFDIVVDSDEVASQILEHLKEERAGRVTFMPLNRLHTKQIVYPKTTDVKPLISEIKFDEVYTKAFMQIFGKTLICKTLATAGQIAGTHHLNCITPEGHQVDRKGAYTGGYYDERTSRLDTARKITELKRELQELTDQSTEAKANVQQTEQKISSILGETHKTEAERKRQTSLLEQIQLDLHSVTKEEEKMRSHLEQKEKQIEALTSTRKTLEDNRAALEAEQDTELTKTLSDEEQTELKTISKQLEDDKAALIKNTATRSEHEVKKNALENLLTTNLKKRQTELREQIQTLGVGDESVQDEKGNRQELERAKENISNIDKQLKDLDQQLETIRKGLDKNKDKIEDLKKSDAKTNSRLQKQAKEMEKLLNQRILASQKEDEYNRKIQELGSVPESAFNGDEPLAQLMKELHGVNEKLKKFSHVNKKANDQFLNFTQQRDVLLSRKTELDSAEEAINKLIDRLDLEKDEAIERTFKMVAANFKKVFEKLVPGGQAALVMVKRKKGVDEEPSQSTSSSSISQYTAVRIMVTFPKRNPDEVEEPRPIKLLSGGQKSIVALALIFAIQECDPAPFYLFDEIDAALDPAYRRAVASLIENVSKENKESEKPPVQFIIATFHPELLDVARKYYLIRKINHISTIAAVDKAGALDIIQTEKERAVQKQEEK